MSQRAISKELDISLGRINQIINALIEKGYVKTKRYINSRDKLSYKYFLTPEGIRKKTELTYDLLKRKREEYEIHAGEIEELREEVRSFNLAGQDEGL